MSTSSTPVVLSAELPFAAQENLEECVLQGAIHGNIRFPVRVFGYWSHDPITVYINRKSSWYTDGDVEKREPAVWKAEVSHSSGGRDTDKLESDTQAARNFGQAIIHAADLAEEFLSRTEEFEELFQAERAASRARYEAERAAEKAAVEADSALGVDKAKALMALAVVNAGPRKAGIVNSYERGSDALNARVSCIKTSRVTWYMSSTMVSAEKATSYLAACSARSYAANMTTVEAV
jgi:hypothetical protein